MVERCRKYKFKTIHYYKYNEGITYQGETRGADGECDHCENGWGILRVGKNYYIGEWKEDKRHGYGTLIVAGKAIATQWEDDIPSDATLACNMWNGFFGLSDETQRRLALSRQ